MKVAWRVLACMLAAAVCAICVCLSAHSAWAKIRADVKSLWTVPGHGQHSPDDEGILRDLQDPAPLGSEPQELQEGGPREDVAAGSGVGKSGTDRRMTMEFLDGRGEYSLEVAGWFEPLRTMLKNLGDNGIEEGVPVAVRKDVFEGILGMCMAEPWCREDMDADEFYGILRGIDYLNIQEEGRDMVLYRNLARRGLLGAHAGDIMQDAGDCVPSITDNIFVRLLGGFASALGKEMRIFGDTATICDPVDTERGDYGSLDAVRLASVVRKIKLVPYLEDQALGESVVKGLAWLARYVGTTSLDTSDFKIQSESMAEIANVGLKELRMSNCNLQRHSILCWFEWDCLLRESLVSLDITHNGQLGERDRVSLASLSLEELMIEGCSLQPGEVAQMLDKTMLSGSLRRLVLSVGHMTRNCMAAISRVGLEELSIRIRNMHANGYVSMLGAEGLHMRSTLRKLHLSYLDLSMHDLLTVSRMAGLEDLELSYCILPQGGVSALLEGSGLRRTLRRLALSDDVLRDGRYQTTERDLMHIAEIEQLQSLTLYGCSIQPGGLQVLSGGFSTVARTLEYLDISYHRRLENEDMEAISRMSRLERLKMFGCTIPTGSLALFAEAGRAIQNTLQQLDISSCNGLWDEDIESLAALRRLRELSMAAVGIWGHLGFLVAGESSLRETLEVLDVSYNTHLDERDTAAISCMAALRELRMYDCKHLHGTIGGLVGGEGCAVRRNLRKLDISYSVLGAADIEALSKLSLEHLVMRGCGLQKGSLVPLGESSTLRSMLRKLKVPDNHLGRRDMEALGKLGLRYIDLSWSHLEEGSLVPLGESRVLRRTLQMLDASGNNSLGKEDKRAVMRIKGLDCRCYVFCYID